MLASDTTVRSPLRGSTRTSAVAKTSTTTRAPSVSTAISHGERRAGPRPMVSVQSPMLMHPDAILRSPVAGSIRTTAARKMSTTTKRPSASTAMPCGWTREGPRPMVVRQSVLTQPDTRVRSPVAGSTRITALRVLSTTTKVPLACTAMLQGKTKGGPRPMVSVQSELTHPDTSVRSPLWGSTRTTAGRALSTTTRVPLASTAMPHGESTGGPLPLVRPDTRLRKPLLGSTRITALRDASTTTT